MRGPARIWRHASLGVGAFLTLAIVAVALLSLVWTPGSPTEIAVAERLQPPSSAHWLGTDPFGRDEASMLMVGARNSLVVGIVAVGIGLGCGLAVGLYAAARRGGIEEVLMRGSDVLFAFPAILGAVMMTAVLGPGVLDAMLAIGIYNVPVFARLARGAASQVWRRDFVRAAELAGKGRVRISLEHVLPNIAPILIVQATIAFATAILAEAALSYLGLGTQPPQPSWGRMLNAAQTYLYLKPALAILPGAAIALAVLGLNLLGDGLSDLLDPRIARAR
jgi:peptide/nickel transport system permease protein